jgi:cyanophycinase
VAEELILYLLQTAHIIYSIKLQKTLGSTKYRISKATLCVALLLAVLSACAPTRIIAPDNRPTTSVAPPKGKLFIVGGNAKQLDSRFIELAGGKNARLVVIPTASRSFEISNSTRVAKLVDYYKQLGVCEVTILHTRDKQVADTEEFVKPLKKATAVWIGGGRQWRLTDSYLNTRTHRELFALLDRGGVIGGSSAGASIQASYMVRGATQGNHIMMAPGHEEGFAFLRGVAIDQHLLARKRLRGLVEVLKVHPELLGIGIDEGTAILVEGDQFQVIGKSKVMVYNAKQPGWPEKTPYTTLTKGNYYNMKTRQVLP